MARSPQRTSGSGPSPLSTGHDAAHAARTPPAGVAFVSINTSDAVATNPSSFHVLHPCRYRAVRSLPSAANKTPTRTSQSVVLTTPAAFIPRTQNLNFNS